MLGLAEWSQWWIVMVSSAKRGLFELPNYSF
jgi:hypothetical protein